MAADIGLPRFLSASVRELGAVGQLWVQELPDLLRSLERNWDISIGRGLDGGNSAYLAEAVTGDGREAVVKAGVPPGIEGFVPFERELDVLLAAGGAPYVEVLAHDRDLRVVLLERLGRPLSDIGLPVLDQLTVTTQVLARGWPISTALQLPTGDEKARWLGRFVTESWQDLDRPCPESTVERALTYTRHRAAAFDPERAVLIHGDGHFGNVLEVRKQDSKLGYRLIDPEGLLSEPAHDLATALRAVNAGLLDDDAGQVAWRQCVHVARTARVEAVPVWEWTFIERVSTGLFLLQMGHEAESRQYLAVAERLTEVDPPKS